MTRVDLRAFSVLVLASLSLGVGCGDYHTLEPRTPTSAAAKSDCTIGVGPLTDDAGVDHSFALREQLRERGPCRHVLMVRGESDDRADLIVSGELATSLEKNRPNQTTVGTFGSVFVALGAIAALGGGTILVVSRVNDTDDDGTRQGAMYATIGGSAAFGTGVIMMIVDGTAIREVEMDGWIEASGTITDSSGSVLDEWQLRDEFQVSTHHPSSRPESIYSHEAHGPLYELAMEKVVDAIIVRVSDTFITRGAAVRAGRTTSGRIGPVAGPTQAAR